MIVLEFNKDDAACYGFDPDSITPEMMKKICSYLHDRICDSVWTRFVPDALEECGAKKVKK